MFKRILVAACLLALPAAAQTNASFTGSCEVHRGDQVRCALRAALVGNHRVVIQVTPGGSGQFSGDAQAWLSECGLPGSASGVSRITNGPAATLHRTNVRALAVMCPEVFIFNCRDGAGQSVPCSRGFGGGRIRMDTSQ